MTRVGSSSPFVKADIWMHDVWVVQCSADDDDEGRWCDTDTKEEWWDRSCTLHIFMFMGGYNVVFSINMWGRSIFININFVLTTHISLHSNIKRFEVFLLAHQYTTFLSLYCWKILDSSRHFHSFRLAAMRCIGSKPAEKGKGWNEKWGWRMSFWQQYKNTTKLVYALLRTTTQCDARANAFF